MRPVVTVVAADTAATARIATIVIPCSISMLLMVPRDFFPVRKIARRRSIDGRTIWNRLKSPDKRFDEKLVTTTCQDRPERRSTYVLIQVRLFLLCISAWRGEFRSFLSVPPSPISFLMVSLSLFLRSFRAMTPPSSLSIRFLVPCSSPLGDGTSQPPPAPALRGERQVLPVSVFAVRKITIKTCYANRNAPPYNVSWKNFKAI